jgi:chaperonin GroES
MRIHPLADHVLIEPLKNEEKTKSGILLPETAEKEKPEQGKVVAVGPGKTDEQGKRIPMEVKAGDVVLFTKYGPNEVKVEVDGQEKEYLIAKEEDILAILES